MVRAQFCRRRFDEAGSGDALVLAVRVARQVVNHHFGHIADDGEPARHVAVKRAVADRELGFVAGAQDERAQFVGQRHEDVAADARLDVFLRHVAGHFSERGIERGQVAFENGINGDDAQINLDVVREPLRVPDAAGRRIGAGHADAHDVFRAERIGGDGCDERGINAPAQSHNRLLESAFRHVVPRSEPQRLVHRLDLRIWAAVHFPFAGRGIENDQVLVERFGARSHAPARVERHARAVENELVVPSHVVDVNDRDVVVRSQLLEHGGAKLDFFRVER